MSKGQIKWIRSLKDKKTREESQTFVVETEKSVVELLQSNWTVQKIICTEVFAQKHAQLLKKYPAERLLMLSESEIVQASQLENNKSALAVVQMPPKNAQPQAEGFCLYLDHIQDPGNLGTIVRIADWYGLQRVFCSLNTVDIYNPKSISASMGSFLRVSVHYVELDWLKNYPHVILGADMTGKNLHEIALPAQALLVIGNEGHGISYEVKALVHQFISIPRFGEAESLNAGVATAIICDNWRRAHKQ
ncbi:MAG: RNA methyltransferase [Cytophagales bacterium]|nr:MAG: RNA methyltransferase [Cytophagales bacterium]TAF60176.1 MAG: RNA methyltransferase [Cytophagales bacterium]